jgi:hypothetical protein
MPIRNVKYNDPEVVVWVVCTEYFLIHFSSVLIQIVCNRSMIICFGLLPYFCLGTAEVQTNAKQSPTFGFLDKKDICPALLESLT